MAAAVAVCRRHGIEVTDPVILQDSNNTVIHLAPAPIVAKVATATVRQRTLDGELQVALHLKDRGAPIVPPADLLPPGPYRESGLELTLWRHVEQIDEPITPRAVGESLRRVHEAMRDFPGPLPGYLSIIERAGDLLADRAQLLQLPDDDRQFMLQVQQRLIEQLTSLEVTMRPLHGEPHAGNLLITREGPRWLDFAAACVGPLEWDLAFLPRAALVAFMPIDGDLLALMRTACSLCVATWCWTDPDRAPELREAAIFHLARLRAGTVL